MAERRGWGRRRRSGGVALAVPLITLCPAAALAEDFVCRGRDPGWELVGRGGQATLVPDKGARRSFSGSASSLPAEGLVVWRGRAGAGQPELVAVMLRGACTDPVAGDVSTHLGVVSLPNADSQVGCCVYGAPAVAAATAPADDAVLAEGDSDEEGAAAAVGNERQALLAPLPPPPKVAKPAKPTPPPAAAPAEQQPPPARSLRAGSTVRVAGSSGESVNLRGRPAGRTVVGQIAGGRSVVVQQSSRQGGHTWYRIRGRGLPANAWIRGDLLLGG